MELGMLGVGVYWCVIEMLYSEGNSLPLEYERIAFELRTDKKVIQSVINDFELFKMDDEYFWSEAVLERLQERFDKSDKAKAAINKRWYKKGNHTSVIRTNNKRNTDVIPVEKSIVENSIVKKEKKVIKVNPDKKSYFGNVFLGDDELLNLETQYGKPLTQSAIKYLSDYKIEKDYRTKNDNLTIRRWVIDAVNKKGGSGNGDRQVGTFGRGQRNTSVLSDADEARIAEINARAEAFEETTVDTNRKDSK